MNYGDFVALISGAPVLYAVFLIATVAIYLFIFRRQINSIFDPLFVATFYSALAASDVIFLWYIDQIDVRYFYQFVLTEAAFFGGVLLFRPPKHPRIKATRLRTKKRHFFVLKRGEEENGFLCSLYIVSVVIFILTQTITYVVRGIPVLYESRLDYYSVGGGVGTLDRIIDVTWFISCYLLIYRLAFSLRIEWWPRLLDGFVGVALIVSGVLSGSRSNLLLIVFAIYYFRFLHREDESSKTADKFLAQLQRITVIAAILAAVFITAVQTVSVNPLAWLLTLSVRFASFGDTFFMAYPSHIVDTVPKGNAFLAMFGSLLATFRFVPYDSIPEPLGILLHRIVYGFDAGVGPNARQNVFGLVYFNSVGSIFYSLAIGVFVGFIRNRLPALVGRGSAIEPIFAFLAISSVWITTDLVLVMKDIGSIILIVPPLYGLAAIVYFASTVRPNKEYLSRVGTITS